LRDLAHTREHAARDRTMKIGGASRLPSLLLSRPPKRQISGGVPCRSWPARASTSTSLVAYLFRFGSFWFGLVQLCWEGGGGAVIVMA
jgi:hypothetical protein